MKDNNSRSNTDSSLRSDYSQPSERSQSDRRNKGGFAALKRSDPERLSKIAAEGGRRAHELGVAHEWDTPEAKAAGKSGGSRGGGR